MTGISELDSGWDLKLGIEGFRYSDLYDAIKLKELGERFYAEVASRNRSYRTL